MKSVSEVNITARIAARGCRTRKRAFHFYSPCVVRRSYSASRQVRALVLYGSPLQQQQQLAATVSAGAASV